MIPLYVAAVTTLLILLLGDGSSEPDVPWGDVNQEEEVADASS